MPTIHFVSLTPNGERTVQDVTARAGSTLMEAAVAAGVRGIAADCGGLATCATCHVIVAEPWAAKLPPAGGDEQGMLDFTAWPRQAGSRLSCQITLSDDLDGITVDLPPKQY
jgi:2Fe-2S ferredoxin